MELIAIILILLYSIYHCVYHFNKINCQEFLINDRSTGLLKTSASAIAGNVGAGTVIGIYTFGQKGGAIALYVSICYAFGLLLTAILASKIYQRNNEIGGYGLVDCIIKYYGANTRYYVWLAIGAIFFTQMASQLLALSTILHAALNIPFEASIFLSYAIVSLYLCSGGYHSVTKTDTIQVIFIIITSLFIFICFDWRGASKEIDIFFTVKNYGNVFIYGIFIFLAPSVFISIDNWHRIISSKSQGTARKAYIIAAFVCFFIYLSYTVIGISNANEINNPILVINNLLPQSLNVLAVLALLMAVISTMDSTILPLVAPLLNDKNDQKSLNNMRLLTLAIMTGIALSAYFIGDIITGIVAAFSSLLALFPAIITILLKRKPCALALKISLPVAILSSLAVVFFNEEYAFIVGIILSFFLYYSIALYEDKKRQ